MISLPTPGKWEPIWNELFPRSKSISSVRFYLYSRLNPDIGQELCINDQSSIHQSNYNPNKRTVFLINGWQDNRLFAKWVRDAIHLLLIRDDQNVIFVGWRSINELFVAAMIIQSYSLYLSRFINFLKVFNFFLLVLKENNAKILFCFRILFYIIYKNDSQNII